MNEVCQTLNAGDTTLNHGDLLISDLLFARVHPRESTNPRIFSIYISFRIEGDKWTKPLELGEKLDMDGNQPHISPAGKFLFFIGIIASHFG